MNRREALTAMGAAGLCPTAAMAIPENHNDKDYSSACDYIAWCYSGQTYIITEKQEKVAAWLKEKIQVYQKTHSHNECLNWLWGHYPIPEKENPDNLLKFPKGSRVKLANLEGLDLKLVGRCGTVKGYEKNYNDEFEWISVQLDGRHWTDWFDESEIQIIP